MGSALISLGKAILANPLFLLAAVIIGIVASLKMWSDSVKESAIKAQENHTASIHRNIEAMQRQRALSERVSALIIKQAELEGKSLEHIGKLKLKDLDKFHNDDVAQRKQYLKEIESVRKNYNLAEEDEDKKKYKDQIAGIREQYNQLGDKIKTFGQEKLALETEINNGIRDEQKANSEKIIANDKTASDKRTAKQIENEDNRLAVANKIQDLILENEDKKNANQEQIIEAHYKFLEDNAQGNAEELLKIQGEKNNKLTQLDLDIYNDAITKQEVNYKREQDDAKGNATILAQLKIKNKLDVEKINIDFDNKQKERENQQIKDTENLNKLKVESERKASQELKSITAELNYIKSKGTSDEEKMFMEFQQSKIDTLKANAQTEIALNKLTGDSKLAVESKLALDTEKITGEKFKKTEEKETQEVEKTLTKEQEKAKKITEVTLQSATQLTDTLSQITQNRIAGEIAQEQNKNDENQKKLQEQLDAGLITEAEFKSKKSELDATFKATESKLKTEAFQKEKQANIIKATMNTALGITGALPNVPLSILAGILGAAQIGLIVSQPTPKFAKGGLFGGNSHANGGTKGYFEDGTQIEVEKDESFFILNKRATPLISQLSNINTATGGVPLMANGGTLKFQNGGAVASSLSNNLDNQLNAQNQLLRMIELMPKPVVVVQDINDAQGNLASVENRANF
jgi:hypothetical protein